MADRSDTIGLERVARGVEEKEKLKHIVIKEMENVFVSTDIHFETSVSF